ncbi:MAG: BMC domain-containing protein [Candidatus Aminicenantes bacterium]|nr:BMC domain-containing protein [Candidatus Aminicenantes bacterium]
MKEPALGIIEYKSVARGIYSCDAMAKKAPIRILETHPICPGKYLTIICGEVADVEESLKAGIESGGKMVVSDLFLPYVHRSVIPAIAGTTKVETFGALGVIESFSVATCVQAADIAVKATPVQLVEIRLANGLGGKAYFVMTGELADVEESLAAAKTFVKQEGMLAAAELIPAPHPDLIAKGVYW